MEALIVFLPLLGAIIAGFFGKKIGDRGAQIVTCSLLIVSAVLSCISFATIGFGEEKLKVIELFTWFDSGASRHPGRCASTRSRRLCWWS